MHKLLIKTHNITGLKYLCYTQKEDHNSYSGSGKLWLKHLKKHGKDISTELIFESENYDEFQKVAVEFSEQYNIVESKQWANLRIEEGDGGDTVSNKRWITNGESDRYILKSEPLPEGWRLGRSNCVFNDTEKQKLFFNKSDRNKAGQSIKKAWDEGRFKRDHSKCGSKGDLNPAKRKEVREKIKISMLNREAEYCDQCQLWFKNIHAHIRRSKLHNG